MYIILHGKDVFDFSVSTEWNESVCTYVNDRRNHQMLMFKKTKQFTAFLNAFLESSYFFFSNTDIKYFEFLKMCPDSSYDTTAVIIELGAMFRWRLMCAQVSGFIAVWFVFKSCSSACVNGHRINQMKTTISRSLCRFLRNQKNH